MAAARITLEFVDLKGRNGSTRVTAVLPHPTGRPFLKWAGGKQWAAPFLGSFVPSGFKGRYYEPFLGGGAAFFAAAPQTAMLSDANEDLVNAFLVVRDDVERLVALLRTYKNDKAFYESMRNKRPRTPLSSAARFIYLNKTAFNGLYRVNETGRFNVPFGRFVNPTICQEARLRDASQLLQGREVVSGDFEQIVRSSQPGDVVYLDPPYITGHTKNGFLKYNARLFSWDDQLRLSNVAVKLREDGVRVLITNADHHAVTSLYGGFHKYTLRRRSLIGGPKDTRKQVFEAFLSSERILSLPTEIIDG